MPIPVRPKPFLPGGCPPGMYGGLARLSPGCPPDGGRLHTCYSPVRRSPAAKASFRPAAPRLACVKPAASVHPEPGSNSPLLVYLFDISFSFCLSSALPDIYRCAFQIDGKLPFDVLFPLSLSCCLVAILSVFSLLPGTRFRTRCSRFAVAKLLPFSPLCKYFITIFSKKGSTAL